MTDASGGAWAGLIAAIGAAGTAGAMLINAWWNRKPCSREEIREAVQEYLREREHAKAATRRRTAAKRAKAAADKEQK